MSLPFAWQIFILLLVLGSSVAFIGNYVGRFFGRRRLTIFGLRPRYTATLFTVVSGALVAVLTLAVVLVISQDARTAFVGIEQLRGQLGELNRAYDEKLAAQKTLEADLKVARQEIGQLQQTKSKLSKEISSTRQGKILFRKGDLISVSLIQGGSDQEKLRAGLQRIIAAAEASLRGYGVKMSGSILVINENELAAVIADLSQTNNVFIVKLLSGSNVVWDETIPLKFEIMENQLVYRKGTEVFSAVLPANLNADQAEDEIVRILSLANQAAREAGVVPDTTGSVGAVPYAQISDLAKKIKNYYKKTKIKLVAKKDINAVGPLEIEFKVSYQ
ncbi:hypothetical protein A2311_04790 [candidate division WOR-1 bacterium RIFOXYB2_FULL_48_7]|uniref:DUF3084 domain-containing protein n=1 Tax=candidate division WOR-1 bacterium RIFOXYB2_FULL_48_7 TaxID=1802583 RepID=A0A1F4TRX8_UNCSA|nr:MAG: hypothetical protein A2311_04790 [candidate division WOR-1 bacterium RIFOXYB2_FULL_48_7]